VLHTAPRAVGGSIAEVLHEEPSVAVLAKGDSTGGRAPERRRGPGFTWVTAKARPRAGTLARTSFVLARSAQPPARLESRALALAALIVAIAAATVALLSLGCCRENG
jgi:hypothetical protein